MDKTEIDRIALMSIHPEFAEALFDGRKAVEFRRVAPRSQVSHIVVYATKPVGAVIGVLEVERVERRSPQNLWRLFGRVGGIDRTRFFEYFEGAVEGAALVVRKAQRLKQPVSLSQKGLPSRPPQSFLYLSDKTFGALGRLLAAA